MAKGQLNVRVSEQVEERVGQLMSWTNETQTGVVTTAINQYFETERTKRMDIQALTEQVARAIARMETDGITGWGLSTPDDVLFEEVEVGAATGCTSSTCNHYSHDPAASTVKLIPRHGEKIVSLGSQNESDGFTEWFAVIGDVDQRLFRLNDRQAYHSQLWEIGINDVPDWALAQLGR